MVETTRPDAALAHRARRDTISDAFHRAALRFADRLALTFGDTLQPTTRRSASRSLRSSWSQAGFLSAQKVRTRPVVTAEALTLALWIGIVEGYQDQRLLESPSVAALEMSLTDRENLRESLFCTTEIRRHDEFKQRDQLSKVVLQWRSRE